MQELGGAFALWADQAFTSVLGQIAPAGLPFPPALILGGGLALALDLVRGRASREKARRHTRA